MRRVAVHVLVLPLVVAAGVAVVAPHGAAAAQASPPVLQTLLARYAAAMNDPGAPELTRYVASGTIDGEGLTGTFRSWHDGERDRNDQQLGPRTESVLSLGERVFLRDSDGDVRELRGVLLRRERTEHFIDAGTFVAEPERCAYRGSQRIGTHLTQTIDVTARGGQTITLYLDDQTALPVRMAYDDDDGRTTIDFAEWHTIAGHRFAYVTVISNGDHAFDVVQTTTSVDPAPDIAPSTFERPNPRSIDMAAPETIPLYVRDGHLYVPVQIGGNAYTFLIDSGAANVLVDAQVARAAGLQEQGALEASGATRTGGLHVARLDDLAIGSGHLHGLVVSTLDLGASTHGAFRIDGVLGYPFFAAATVQIDYGRAEMRFGPPGSFAPRGTRLDLELDRALPEATFRLNDALDGQFVVDTGDAAEMLLYRPFVDRHPGVVQFTTAQRSSFGVGGATTSYRTDLDRLDVAGTPLYHTAVDVMLATSGAFADRFSAGNVGLGVLKNFVVTFDDANAALYVEKGSLFDDGRYRYK